MNNYSHDDLKKKHNTSRSIFYITVIFLIACILYRDILNNALSMHYIVIPIIALCIFLSFSHTISIIVFLIPFENVLQVSMIYTGLLLILIFKFLYYQIKIDREGILVIIAIALWELAHSIIPPFSTIQYFKLINTYLLVGLIIFSMIKSVDYEDVINSYIWGVALFGILLFQKELINSNYNLSLFMHNIGRFGQLDFQVENESYYGLYNNPNAIGLYNAVAISIIAANLAYKKRGFLINLFLFQFLLLIGLLTKSKTFFILSIYIFVIIGISLINKSYRKTSFIKIIIGLLIFGIFFSFLFNNKVVLGIIKRFKNNFLSGRDIIFSYYLNYISENISRLIFGIGIQSMNMKAGIYSNPHNAFQEVLIAWGGIGLLFSIYFMYTISSSAMRKSWSTKKRSVYKLISHFPYTVFLIGTQTSRIFKKVETFAIFIIVYYFYFYWATVILKEEKDE